MARIAMGLGFTLIHLVSIPVTNTYKFGPQLPSGLIYTPGLQIYFSSKSKLKKAGPKMAPDFCFGLWLRIPF